MYVYSDFLGRTIEWATCMKVKKEPLGEGKESVKNSSSLSSNGH
jgi:hypothetical protein